VTRFICTKLSVHLRPALAEFAKVGPRKVITGLPLARLDSTGSRANSNQPSEDEYRRLIGWSVGGLADIGS
jgi:hypothetical protein